MDEQRRDDWRLTAILVVVVLQAVMLWGIGGTLTAMRASPPNPLSVPERGGTAGTAGTADGGDREEGDGMAQWRVSGAGSTAYNGDYAQAGEHNGQPYYTYAGGAGTRYLWWDGVLWRLGDVLGVPDAIRYSSSEVTLPGNPWVVEEGAIPPAPTVSLIDELDSWVGCDDARGVTYEALATATISAIRAYVRTSTSARVRIVGAIYDSTDDSLVAATQATWAGPTAAWVTLGFASPPTLTDGVTYYLMVWGQDGTAQVGITGTGTNAWVELGEPAWDSWEDPCDLSNLTGGGSYMIEAADGWLVGAIESAYRVEGPLRGMVRSAYRITTPIGGSRQCSYAVIGAREGRERSAYAVTRATAGDHTAAYRVEGDGGQAVLTAVLWHYMSEGRVL